MTGETEKSPSGWTPDTLKVLEDEKIAALERLFTAEIRRLDEALAAQDRAAALRDTASQIAQDKFEATVERDSVKQNEFRGSLEDLGKTMATRRETETTFAALTARVDDLGKQIGDLRSRIDVGPSGLAALQTRADTQIGQSAGVQLTVGYFFAGLAALGTLVAIVAYLASH